MYHQISDIDEKSPVSCWAAYHGCIGSSFCSIYFLSFIRMMIERIAPSMFVPAKFSHIPSSPRGDRARIRSRFEKLWNDVSSSLNQEWEVERLCQMMNFSRSQLTRLCKKLYGETPGEKIRRIRMENAKILLSSSSLSILEVADAVGYTSPSLFSSSFSSFAGMSPREYRNMRRRARGKGELP